MGGEEGETKEHKLVREMRGALQEMHEQKACELDAGASI
jgi:hypothetical protein